MQVWGVGSVSMWERNGPTQEGREVPQAGRVDAVVASDWWSTVVVWFNVSLYLN